MNPFSSTKPIVLAASFLGLMCWAPEAEANWPRWRGAQDNGSTSQGQYPAKWDPAKPLWKAPLPGKGCSTPIVWDRHIYLTAPTEGLDAVLAFDWSGAPLWKATLGPEQAGKHRNGSGSNPSPVTDGSGIFVYFKSGNLAALEFDGKVRWQLNLVEQFGREKLYWDQGTSPVLTEKHVIVARMHEGDSWLAAFDKQTGELSWKMPRNYKTPTEGDHAYTTPIVVQHNGSEVVLVWGAEHVTAHAAADGRVLWSCGEFNPDGQGFLPAVASAVVVGDVVIVPHGRADRGKARLHGIKLGGSGDVTSTHRVWKREGVGAFVPTPAALAGRLYVLRDRGEVDCLDSATGKTLWTEALPRASASYYASPVVADGKLYAIREDGVVFVAKVEGEFEVLAEIDMGERIIASVVPVSNRLLIRGEQHLFCVGDE